MKDITIQDKAYDINKTEHYRLSIQLSMDGFSYTTLDTLSGKFNSFYYESLDESVDYEDYLSRIENFIEKDIFSAHYRDVSIVSVVSKSTLIPATMFDKNNLKQLFELNITLDDDSAISFNKIRNSEIYCLYPTPSFISTVLVNKFHAFNLYHQGIPLIEDVLMNLNPADVRSKVYVNVERGMFDMLVICNAKVQLYNTFETKSFVDVVYFIMNCYEQLKLDRKSVPLLLTGIYDLNSELIVTLRRFITNIEHESLKRSDFAFEAIFKTIPVSRFPNLFKILKCE